MTAGNVGLCFPASPRPWAAAHWKATRVQQNKGTRILSHLSSQRLGARLSAHARLAPGREHGGEHPAPDKELTVHTSPTAGEGLHVPVLIPKHEQVQQGL